MNLHWGHVRSHTKFGPDRFSRFDVYWIQTNKHPQTDTQTSKVYIYVYTSQISMYIVLHERGKATSPTQLPNLILPICGSARPHSFRFSSPIF